MAKPTADPLRSLRHHSERVEARLPRLIPDPGTEPRKVHEAMGYALMGRGKRLRPVLTLVVADMFGSASEPVLDLACTVELVHACSLILDDLPSMDDAATRRGRPSTHIVFGEEVALLAAFGLLNRAYALAAESSLRLSLKRYTLEDLIHHLAMAVGSEGLIGGQALDLESDPQSLSLERLEFIHSHKTGALFIAAAEFGAMAVGARRKDFSTITRYAKNLGLAFQITDDLLDVEGTEQETGKPTGQDRGKVTFVSLLGVEGAQALANELLGFAVQSLAALGPKADPLRGLADYVRIRRH